MVTQIVDGRFKFGIFIQRPGTTYFHIIWQVRWRAACGTADASHPKDRSSTVRDSLNRIDQPPPYEPVEFKEQWINRGSGVWRRKLEHCHSTQWGINTHKQADKSFGPDPNPNLTFTCKEMLRQPKDSTQAALDTICKNIALKLLLHRQKQKCTCDLRFLRLGRVDLAFNDPAAHRCSNTTLRVERILPEKTVIDWIHLHDALCYCCCFSAGVNWPTRLSSPRPNHDDQGASGNLRKATNARHIKDPTGAVRRSGNNTCNVVYMLWK